MIKLTKNNISRFTKRLQKSILNNTNINIKLNISRKIFAEIFGTQSIKELENFIDNEDKNNEIRTNFIEESKNLQKNQLKLMFPQNFNFKEIQRRPTITQSTVVGDIKNFTPSVTDKIPEDNLKLIERLRKDNLTASDDDIENCRILYKEKNNTHYLDKFTLYELINEQFIYFCKFNYLEGIRKIMTSNESSLQNFLDIFNYSLREVNETNSMATYGYVALTHSNLEIQRYLLTGKYYLNNIQYQDDLSLFHKNSFSTTKNIHSFLFSANFYNLNKFKYFYTKKYNENNDRFPFNVDGEELLLDKFRMICHTINKDNPLLFDFIIEELLNKNNIDIKELLIQGLKWSVQPNNEKIIFSNVLPSIIDFKKKNQFLFSKKEVLNIIEQHINDKDIHEHKDNIIKNIETIILDR